MLKFDDFGARFLARDDFDAGFRHGKMLGQEREPGFVGFAVVRARVQIDGQTVGRGLDDFFLRRAGFDLDDIFHDYIIAARM